MCEFEVAAEMKQVVSKLQDWKPKIDVISLVSRDCEFLLIRRVNNRYWNLTRWHGIPRF